MFKSAARKIAHNTTMPGLAGKQDLRPLQDLITAEKAVLNSLQRLSNDFARASDALRMWGQGEGDDLGDTLVASNALLLHFAAALSTFANHEGTIREQMKAVRTREENLDELKRRRKSIFTDAEAAERKLSKMNPENKNLQQQTDHLNRLREEIRTMDADIMAEEASLGDFKRGSVRSWMGRKYGALQECCEKGTIVGELGKLVISEIPTEMTQPGMPRPYYSGHARTEFLVAEASRSVSEVQYSSEPNPNPTQRAIRPLPGTELPAVPSPSQTNLYSNNNPYIDAPGSPPVPGAPLGLPQIEDAGFSIPQFGASELPPQPSVNPPVGEFGTYTPSPSNQPSSFSLSEGSKASSPRGGRFATFPVKAQGPRPAPGAGQGSAISSTNPYVNAPPPLRDGDRAPSLELDRNEESFSSSVAVALGRYSLDGTPDNAGGPSASGSNHAPLPPQTSRDRKSAGGNDFGHQRYSPPPPMYTPSNNHNLPAGAAPSHPPSAMYNNGLGAPGMGLDQPGSRPQSSVHDEVEGLAYMSDSRANASTESLSESGNRRVHFGDVKDVDEEMQKRKEAEGASARPTRVPVPPMDELASEIPPAQDSDDVPPPPPATLPAHSEDAALPPQPPSPPRMPRSPTPPAAQLLDERSLNAAAAREVSRELDALMMSTSPPQSPPASPYVAAPPYGASPYQQRNVSPLPSLNTSQPMSSQPTSPRMEGYVRERDRSMNPLVLSKSPEHPASTPASPTASESSGRRPSVTVPGPRTSPSPSIDANGTPYRTPMSTPMAPPPGASSMYNLSGGTGSTPSVASGPRTISAAAFRRPPPQARMPTQDGSVADTSPLNVKKRSLPSTPNTPHSLIPGQGMGMGMPRVVSAPYMQDGARPASHYRQDGEEEDFDFSAYTDGPDRASGYGSGRFATNTVDDGNLIR